MNGVSKSQHNGQKETESTTTCESENHDTSYIQKHPYYTEFNRDRMINNVVNIKFEMNTLSYDSISSEPSLVSPNEKSKIRPRE